MQNWNLQRIKKPQALVSTAHPDDEIIFCGGMLLTYPDWLWQIVCVTMQPGIRQQEFKRAIIELKNKGVNIIKYYTLDRADNGQPLANEDFADWFSAIAKLELTPDIVFTHNLMGEYGHPHHMPLKKIAHSHYRNVWDFVFPGKTNIAEQVVKENINEIKLTPKILNAKNEVFETAYSSQKVLWKALPDIMQYEFKSGPETFTS